MYDRIFDSVSPAQMAGVAFHLYPTTGDPGAEIATHVDACYTAGLEQLPVYLTELGFQYGIYGIYQPWSSANTFNTYYNDERVGGIYFYRLAPQQPTPLAGETFQRYPLTTNQPLEDELTRRSPIRPAATRLPTRRSTVPPSPATRRRPPRYLATTTPRSRRRSSSPARSASGCSAPRTMAPRRTGSPTDTAALQETIDAALAYDGMGTVQFSASTYLVDSAVRTDRSGRCQVLDLRRARTRRSRSSCSGQRRRRRWIPPTSATRSRATGSIIKSTLTGLSYSGTFGPPSVIGGGTEEQGISATREHAGIVPNQRDFIVQIPANPGSPGWTLPVGRARRRGRRGRLHGPTASHACHQHRTASTSAPSVWATNTALVLATARLLRRLACTTRPPLLGGSGATRRSAPSRPRGDAGAYPMLGPDRVIELPTAIAGWHPPREVGRSTPLLRPWSPD